ncbi:oxidoreductase [Aedoeadaptatus coxii]|uniref:Oxidoreductase n=1 Tax=Aedoeadaptatus coxii TaxID=755172 RepID=A0A134ACY5_9FIRM|nr:C-GCAxxG-C-C family protein [Peptoniphilus coxii]KXB65569.1 oxidoreductase [Peptoniphilus coxii]
MTSKEKNCAQNVLGAFGKEFGLSEDITDRMAAPFGGARYSGETCGCVSAATMVLGLKYGDDETYLSEKVASFDKAFKEKHRSTQCREILGYDFSKPGELAKAYESGSIAENCPKCVSDSIAILQKLLDS